MKKITALLTIMLCLQIVTRSQEIPNIEHLAQLEGRITTYYTEDLEQKARYLQALLTDAVEYFETMFRDTFDLQLLVLNKDTWKYYATTPWPLSEIRNDPYRIIMPDFGIYKVREVSNSDFFGNDNVFFWDFICVHELGHYISQKYNARTYTAWSAEFFADFVQISYMKDKIPDFAFPEWGYSLWKLYPMQFKSLADFERNEELNPFTLIAYQEKFYELCFKIYDKHGPDFIESYVKTYSIRNTLINKDYFKNLSGELMIEFSKEFIKRYDADVFDPWEKSMHKSYLYYIILSVSFIILILSAILKKHLKIFIYRLLLTLSIISVIILGILFVITRI